MKITVNPNTKAGGFGYAPEGEYELRVVSCEQKTKSGSEYPYLEWQFEFVDPNIVPVEEDAKLGKLYEITTLKDDAQFALRAITDALGLEWGDFDNADVKGLTLRAKVTIGEYKGNKRNEIARFIPAS